jgi:hypothetical protein
MAVDSPHDDDAVEVLRGRHRDHDDGEVSDAEFSAYDRPIVRVDREECYTELRAFHAVEMQVSSRDWPERTSDGQWKWKGLELDAATNRIADAALATRREAEGRDAEGNYGEAGITPAMRRIEGELEHGSLVPDTERFALKSPDRFKEKLAKLITLEPDSSSNELADRIHDGIRYTFTFEKEVYSVSVKQAETLLADAGFELRERKPSWSGTEYKGINTQWCDRNSGHLFEVQFHTPESWDAKQRTHDAYEKVTSPTTLVEERVRLRAFQRTIADSVPIPPGALDFVPYKWTEGRQ